MIMKLSFDLMLPDMDGFDLFKKLKQIKIFLYYLSARGDIGNKNPWV